MSILSLSAPAKINLSLRVLRKRDDGFHDIDSIMVKLPSLTDQIDFDASEILSFECSDPHIPSDDSNLVMKAARAYQAATGQPCAYRITLRKNIPHGAGLGGGSSDAATTLLGLDQLHDGKLGMERLHQIAAQIGSDIPFFLHPGAAHSKGRGEIIQSISPPPSMPLLLLKPSFGVPTPDAYRRWSDSIPLPGITSNPQHVGPITLVNDLEIPVFSKHRFLAELKLWLLARREVSAALLCGSGSTIFAILKNNAEPEMIASAARYELDPGLWHWFGPTEG